MIQPRPAMKIRERRITMHGSDDTLLEYDSSSVVMGTFATGDPDEYLTTIWEFTDLFFGNIIAWGIVARVL